MGKKVGELVGLVAVAVLEVLVDTLPLVGDDDGDVDGPFESELVSSTTGLKAGVADGLVEGANEGDDEGDAKGRFEGASVGVFVGLAVTPLQLSIISSLVAWNSGPSRIAVILSDMPTESDVISYLTSNA